MHNLRKRTAQAAANLCRPGRRRWILAEGQSATERPGRRTDDGRWAMGSLVFNMPWLRHRLLCHNLSFSPSFFLSFLFSYYFCFFFGRFGGMVNWHMAFPAARSTGINIPNAGRAWPPPEEHGLSLERLWRG